METKQLNRIKWVTIILSLVLFITSLTQTAIVYDDFDGRKSFEGYELTLMGAIAVLGGGLMEWVIWLANPLFIVAIILLLRGKTKALFFSIAAMLLGLSFMVWNNILVAEDGRMATILSLQPGYILWILSFAVFAVGAFLYYRISKQGQS